MFLAGLFPVWKIAENYQSSFDALVDYLRREEYDAAGIDAPFSIPKQFIENYSYGAVLSRVSEIPKENRSFPKGFDFVRVFAGQDPPLTPPKPYRVTDRYWIDRGVNTRSTMWHAARAGIGRPGSPMTAACMMLIYETGCPVWPWNDSKSIRLLVEAFPAGQLCQWNLPHQKYQGKEPSAMETRNGIIGKLKMRMNIKDEFTEYIERDGDALDSVICTFAAIAVTKDKVAIKPGNAAIKEGWISVHE